MSGLEPALSDVIPRMVISGSAVGSLPDTIDTPDTFPSRAEIGSLACCRVRFSPFSTPAEPVKASRFCLPKATTTTSSITFELVLSLMVTSGAIFTVWGSMPTKVTVMVRSVGLRLVKVNLPLMSVAVVFFDPVTRTVAPNMGSSSSAESTTPVMRVICAKAVHAISMKAKMNVALLIKLIFTLCLFRFVPDYACIMVLFKAKY